jgi:hypothetical protein
MDLASGTNPKALKHDFSEFDLALSGDGQRGHDRPSRVSEPAVAPIRMTRNSKWALLSVFALLGVRPNRLGKRRMR